MADYMPFYGGALVRTSGLFERLSVLLGYILSLVGVSFGFCFPWQKRLTSLVNYFRKLSYTDCHTLRLLFPSFLLELIMHSCIEIQYGGQQNCSYFPATAARFVQKDSLKHNVLNYPKDRSLLYVFRKDRRCIFFYFY